LGETPLPVAKKSIWDYLSQKDRERLQGFKNVETGTTTQSTSTSAPPPVTVIDVPRTDAPVAKAALQGFQPFVDNPLKQTRYIAYLTSQASSQPMTLQPLPGQSIQDFNTELEGFAKAARVFKPMSAAMASRFVGAKVAEKTKEVKEGLYQPAEEAYLEGEKAEDEAGGVPVEESPKEHAARMGMFGKMTRESKEWAPARLLCKRFKVPLPKNEGGKEEEERGQEYVPTTNDPKGDVSMEMMVDVNGGGRGTRVVVNESDGAGEGVKRDIANIGLGEDDTQGRDTLTYERPAMDIFKAIFASDEEDSDEENKEPSKSTADTSGDVKMADGLNTTETKPPIPFGPVDLTTFRPTFVSRSKMGGTTSAEKSSKPTKKKTKVAPLSFKDEDGEGTGITVVPAKKRKRDKDGEGVGKKKKTEEKEKSVKMEVDEEDDAMWVEKPSAVPTQIVKNRPKAADFL
jgi:G patch domain-containing protein 1